jgi:hypothetical protein
MEIYKKLLAAKKELGKISKDSTNPFFKSKYFDVNALLEHVEPILQSHGLLLMQPIEDGLLVKTVIYDCDSGESVSSEMNLPSLNDPQKIGSAITYYRRYTLQSLLGLQAEDDDANKASRPTPVKAVDYTRQKTRLNSCDSMDQLATVYKSFTPAEQKATYDVKEQMKTKLQ